MPRDRRLSAAGLPVEIGQIDRELKKLWDASDGVMTRASLINLAVYSEAPDSLGKNTAIISQITENHACRAIVIAADPEVEGERSRGLDQRALPRQPAPDANRFAPNSFHFCSKASSADSCRTLFSRSSIPIFRFTSGGRRSSAPPIDPQLWAWVDRVIYDSQIWRNFGEQMQLVETTQHEARQRIVLCDLNWKRLIHLRIALAQFFDHPATHHHLAGIKALEIEHAPGFRSTALLLVGWLAGQLGWERSSAKAKSLGFRKKTDDGERKIKVSLRRKEGEPISACQITTESAVFRIEHKPGADLLDVFFGRTEGRKMRQLLPAGKNDVVELVQEELMRGGPHRVYLRAVEQVRDLL